MPLSVQNFAPARMTKRAGFHCRRVNETNRGVQLFCGLSIFASQSHAHTDTIVLLAPWIVTLLRFEACDAVGRGGQSKSARFLRGRGFREGPDARGLGGFLTRYYIREHGLVFWFCQNRRYLTNAKGAPLCRTRKAMTIETTHGVLLCCIGSIPRRLAGGPATAISQR